MEWFMRHLVVSLTQPTLYWFTTESDKQLMIARLLRSYLQLECSILLIDQLNEGWFHRSFTCCQQLTCKPADRCKISLSDIHSFLIGAGDCILSRLRLHPIA